jgi:site-specific recombinase XerD
MAADQLHTSFFINKNRTDKHGESAVSLRITINGQRESINTGVSIEPGLWDNAKERIRGKSEYVNSQNNLLGTIRSKVTRIYTEIINSGMPVTSAIIKSKFNGNAETTTSLLEVVRLHNAYVYKKVGIEVVKATHVKYETLRKKLEAYMINEYNRNDLFLKELNQRFLLNFELFLKVNEKIAHNTTIKYVQFLKRIINYAISNEWIAQDPFKAFKCTFQPVIRECLTQEEIDRIQTKELPTQRLAQVRDIFVFCCYTGLAYADVKKLRYSEIAKGLDGDMWIQTFRAKTNTRVPIPLLPQALALIDAYRDHHNVPGSLVFPVPSNQKTNAYLKEIADVCGITKRLTFHLARHSFATTVTLSNGVPIETVSKMLGHTNIKTTQIYSKVLDLKISGDMMQLRQKMKK